MLHVLHTHALRAADEDRQGIRALYEVLDLEPLLLSLLAMFLRGVHEAPQMVEHTLCLVVRCGGDETHPILSGLHRRGVLPRREAHPHELGRRRFRTARAQDEALEIVIREVPFSHNQRQWQSLRSGEEVSAVTWLDSGPFREPGGGSLRVRNADVDVLDHPRRRRGALRGVEESQLADPASGADEGVAVRAVYHVEPQVRSQELGGRIPVAHVERYVIQLLYLHIFSLEGDRLREDTTRAEPIDACDYLARHADRIHEIGMSIKSRLTSASTLEPEN